MSKVKIYNMTKQLINLNVLSLDGEKEVMVPLVAKGCKAIDSSQETKDISIKRKAGMIKLERVSDPVPKAIKDVKSPVKEKDTKKTKKDKSEK